MLARIATLAICLAASVAARATEIVRVWTEWRDAESFLRLSELVDGRENPGNEIYLRTHPESRDGFYFLVRLAHATATDATFEAQVIMPGKTEPVVFKFPASVPSGSQVFELGLTGPDWPEKKLSPSAWRIALVDSSGAEIAAHESFLWSPPK